jgi:hypothetical protein
MIKMQSFCYWAGEGMRQKKAEISVIIFAMMKMLKGELMEIQGWNLNWSFKLPSSDFSAIIGWSFSVHLTFDSSRKLEGIRKLTRKFDKLFPVSTCELLQTLDHFELPL